MALNFKVSGTGPPLIILHGFLGSLDNWQTHARALSDMATVYIVDGRNHGRSPHYAEHSYALMAEDLKTFMNEQGIAKASLLGHSMGGKTVMEFANRYPTMIEKLIIADISPRQYTWNYDRIFEALFYVKLDEVEQRSDAERMLREKISEEGMVQFLLKSLDRNPDGSYEWKMNLAVLYQKFDEVIKGIELNSIYPFATLIIRGGKSKYVEEKDIENYQAHFSNIEIVTLENAGHWLHAEEPKEFLDAVRRFLLEKHKS
jgi:pimeloyl-ACP methyl ester carboxylesterase